MDAYPASTSINLEAEVDLLFVRKILVGNGMCLSSVRRL